MEPVLLVALYNIHSYGIRGLHSYLLKLGYDVSSAYFRELSYKGPPATPEQVDRFVKGIMETRKPKTIAFGVHTPVFQIFKRVSKSVRKQFPKCKIIIGGEHPTADPESCLPYADYVVVGEGETAMIEILEGKASEGIVGPYELFKDLDSLPLGHYGEGTIHFTENKILPLVQSYITGRGCPYNCTYCHESVKQNVYGKNYVKERRRSVSRVMEDLQYYQSVHGMKKVFFSDPVFLTNKKWLKEFSEEYKKINMPFGIYGHTLNVTKENILMLKDVGLGGVRLGVQSGSRYIREEIYNRKENIDDTLKAAWLLYDLGVGEHSYDFIVNGPYDNAQTLKETRDFIDELPPQAVIQNFELRWFPNLPLTNRALADGYIGPKNVEGQYDRFGDWSYCYQKGAL